MHVCNNSSAAAIALLVSAAALPASDNASAIAGMEHHFSIQLHSLFTPRNQNMGLFLKARVAGGPLLRLLLDSGAQHVVLDKHAASSLIRRAEAPLDIVGLGASSGSARRLAPADVEIDGLAFRACEILSVDSQLLEGIDGVVPLSLFEGFLVRLNLPAKTLELDPYPSGPPASDAGYSPARTEHNLLFLHAVVNGVRSGYVLLDTGATYSALSLTAARSIHDYRVNPSTIALRGAGGDADGFPLPSGMQFRLGSQALSADPAIAIDLTDFNRHYPFEITGVLGYPALRRSVITINYRDGLIRIQ